MVGGGMQVSNLVEVPHPVVRGHFCLQYRGLQWNMWSPRWWPQWALSAPTGRQSTDSTPKMRALLGLVAANMGASMGTSALTRRRAADSFSNMVTYITRHQLCPSSAITCFSLIFFHIYAIFYHSRMHPRHGILMFPGDSISRQWWQKSSPY